MDYSKVDWSRCKLPDCNAMQATLIPLHNGAHCVLGTETLIVLNGEMMSFFPFGATDRKKIQWALKAADAVDAFLREEQKRVESESQPWMTAKELLRELCERESILVKTSRGQTWELRLTEEIQRRNVFEVRFEPMPFGWFTGQNYQELAPQSQPDTLRVEKKWKESLVVTGEHKLIAVRAVSPATLEISNTIQNPVTTDRSALPVPGQRVRLTLEVEE